MESYDETVNTCVRHLKDIFEKMARLNSNESVRRSLAEARKEEDELFKKVNLRVSWDALRQLREDRIKTLKEMIPDNDDEKLPDEAEFKKLWDEEIERY